MAARRPELPRHARRWDAVVLGGALPGLVAAARLAVQGQRVLIVEESAATEIPPVAREPFYLAGARGGVLDACLRELGLPLIERRALEPHPVALQMILSDARLDVGEPQWTADEMVAWGIAKPEAARALLRALASAAEAELGAMLAAPVVRSGGLRNLSRTRPSLHGRGLPVEVSQAEGRLRDVLDALARALSHVPEAPLPPEARARLLGTPLAGGAGFPDSSLGLRELLLRRIRQRHGERRSVAGPFCFAQAGQHPAVAVDGAGELWSGRVIVVNAPAAALAGRLRDWERPVPGFLDEAAATTHRRLTLHLEVRSDALPEAMARSLICAHAAGGLTTVARYPRPETEEGEAWQDLVAQRMVPLGEPEPSALEALEADVVALLPFAGERVRRRELPRPAWDDDFVWVDPTGPEGWPTEVETRVSSRPPVHVLARESLANLGLEGDLLLGWRAGDALAAELS